MASELEYNNNDPEFKGFLSDQNSSNWMDIGLAIIKSKIGFPGPTSHLSANYITTGTTGGPLYNNLINYIEGTEMSPALIQSQREDLKNMVDRGATFTIRALHTLFPGKLKKSDETVIRNVVEACGNNLGAAMPLLQQSLGLDKEQSSFLFNAIFGEEGSRRVFATSAAGTLKPLVGAGYANKFLKTMLDAEMGEGAYKRDEHFGRAPSEVAEIMKVMAERGQLRIKQSDFNIRDNERRMAGILNAGHQVTLDEDLVAAMAKQRESRIQSDIQNTASYRDSATEEVLKTYEEKAKHINDKTSGITLETLLDNSTNNTVKNILAKNKADESASNFNIMHSLQDAGIVIADNADAETIAKTLGIDQKNLDATTTDNIRTLSTDVATAKSAILDDTKNLYNYLDTPIDGKGGDGSRRYNDVVKDVKTKLEEQGIKDKTKEKAQALVKANAIQNIIGQINSYSNETAKPLNVNTTKNIKDSLAELHNRETDFLNGQPKEKADMIKSLFSTARELLTDFGNGTPGTSAQDIYKQFNTELSDQARESVNEDQNRYKNYVQAVQNKQVKGKAYEDGLKLKNNPTAFKEMQDAYANSYAFDKTTTNIQAAEESATMLMTAFEQSGQEITAEQAATVLYNIVGDAKQQNPDEIISKVNEFTQNMRKSGRTGAQTLAAVVRDATVAKKYGLSGNSNARTAIMTASMLGAVSGQENQLSSAEKEAVSSSLAENTARATQDIGLRGLGLMKYLSAQDNFDKIAINKEDRTLIDKIKNNKTESLTEKEFERLPALAQEIGRNLGYNEASTASFMNSNRALDNVDSSAILARGSQLAMSDNTATINGVYNQFKGLSTQDHIQLAQALIGKATDIEAAFNPANKDTKNAALETIKKDITNKLTKDKNTAAAAALNELNGAQLDSFLFQIDTAIVNDAENQQKSVGQLEAEYKIDPATIAANKQINEAKNKLRKDLKETSKGNMTQLFDTLTSKDGDIVKAIGAISNIQDLTPIIEDKEGGGLSSLATAKVLTEAELDGENSPIWKAIKNGMDVTALINNEYKTSDADFGVFDEDGKKLTAQEIQKQFNEAKTTVETAFTTAVNDKKTSTKEEQLSAMLKGGAPAQEPAVSASEPAAATPAAAAAAPESPAAPAAGAAASDTAAQPAVTTAPETTSVPVAEGSSEPVVQLTQKVIELNTNIEKVVAALNSGKAINVHIIDGDGEQPGTRQV